MTLPGEILAAGRPDAALGARDKRPDRIVFVDEIPIATTGKVDRRRLLAEAGL